MVTTTALREGLRVTMAGDTPLLVRDWTAQAESSSGVGALLRLRDDGDAEELDPFTLLVAWSGIARMSEDELRYAGLPDVAPVTIEINARGTILGRDFEISTGFLRDGRRARGLRRIGAWLRDGSESYVLLDPLYTIVELVDRYNQADGADLESRMLRWGRIADMLPDDAVVRDGHLRSIRIAVASSFELSPFTNSDGEPDFDPVVGRFATRETETGEQQREFVAALPNARQKAFAGRFRRLRTVKHRYPVGGSWYLVLTPEVEMALGVVRRAQTRSSDERRDFLMNASARLRDGLEQGNDDPGSVGSVNLDIVFSDDGLSERVEGVGIWTKKILPWVKRAGEPWLPPEALGVRIGDRVIHLEADDLVGLVERVKRAIKRGDATVQIRDGVEVPANGDAVAALTELMRTVPPVQPPEPGDVPEPGDGQLAQSDDQVLLVIDNLDETRFSRPRKERPSADQAVLPALRTQLLPHQHEALEWLMGHWNAGSWGALLADDMGLGKTLSALAFLSWLQRTLDSHARSHPCPLLVVAPAGLLRNWKAEHDTHMAGDGLGREIEAHGASLRRLRVATGTQHRTELTDGEPTLDVGKLKGPGWVLTTYETLRNHQHSFGRVQWRAAVFDEAQKIKNPGVRVTEAALALNVDFALLMTGTPVENRPADIWSILDRAEPGMFGSLKDFSSRYEGDDVDEASMEELHRSITEPVAAASPGAPGSPPLMLRRLKADRMRDLPEKQLHRRVVQMPAFQAHAYEQAVLDRSRGLGALQVLHRLRSISLHPFAPDDRDLDSYIGASARLSETFRILERIAGVRQKALLFVESHKMQNFLIGALRRRFRLRDDVLAINGAVAGTARKARVDAFQQRHGFDVMVLSPRAGGVGLTLTAANHVIHLSRWWNPAVEDQSTDRAFRIGQRRTVHVYLLLAKHPRFDEYSFDLRLDSLMERKRRMNRLVLAAPAATNADIDELYRSTVTRARDSGPGGASRRTRHREDSGINIDLMEPTRFEDWVLEQLARAGYETHRTPRSGDGGADGLALRHGGSNPHNMIVQCKHISSGRRCGVAAVREVLNSISRYKLRGHTIPMVVTTAAGFTGPARQLADESGVLLIDRSSVCRLQDGFAPD